MKKFLRIIKDVYKYQNIKNEHMQIIVFLEKKSDINYFKRYLSDLYKFLKIKIIILCSEFLAINEFKHYDFENEYIYIGEGLPRFLYFKLIKAKIFLMTTPDLENSELKRSIHAVKYFYIFHSPVSSHAIYNHNAFKHYDYILSAGPHHCKEIKLVEKFYSNKKKFLIPFGYPRILDLKEEYLNTSLKFKKNNSQKTILIAPTWGKSSITDNCIEIILKELIKENFRIIFRPHPISLDIKENFILKLKKEFIGKVFFELDVSNTLYLNDVDLLITDWSGFSIEFFLTTKKPTLFVDTPNKINNKNFSDIKLVPLEKKVRTEIGSIIKIDSIHKINIIINNLMKKKYIKIKDNYIYDYSQNYKKSLSIIKNILDDQI